MAPDTAPSTAQLTPAPPASLAAIFALAERTGKPIDLHRLSF